MRIVWDLWDNIKRTNIQIIGVPEEEKKKKGYEKIFEEIIVENFPNMEKEIVNQVQEAQRVPFWINWRRNISRHILIKLTKTKYKERILKAARDNRQVTYKGNPIVSSSLKFSVLFLWAEQHVCVWYLWYLESMIPDTSFYHCGFWGGSFVCVCVCVFAGFLSWHHLLCLGSFACVSETVFV